MPRKKLETIYKSSDYAASQTNGPPGVLSGLFRTIMHKLMVGPEKWGYLMRLYVQDPRNGVPDTDADRGSTRGNLSTALSNDWMTWKVFMRGLRFLRISHIRIALELHTEDGQKHIVSREVNITGAGDAPFNTSELRETLKYVIAEECGEDALDEFDDEPNSQLAEEPSDNE
jgi:hypothetical protein